MDVLESVNCAELMGVLDAAARLPDAIRVDEAVQGLIVALARLVGYETALEACIALVKGAVDGMPQLRDLDDGAVAARSPTSRPVDARIRGVPKTPTKVARPTPVAPTGSESSIDERRDVVLRLLAPHLEAAFKRVTHRGPALTPRERQVLELVREGHANASIARTLGVAESTVIKHLEHVYARVGAHSRTQAIRICESTME